MKKLILIMSVLAFLAVSCRTGKDNNIHVNYAKEKDHFKKSSKKKYKNIKDCNNTFKK